MGRQLSKVYNDKGTRGTTTDDTLLYSYTYDDNGLRQSKTKRVGTTDVKTTFTWADGNMTHQTDGTNELYFRYDSDGSLVGFDHTYNNVTKDYYYVKNLQGDIIAILDNMGALVAEYEYDAWGKLLSVKNGSGVDVSSNASHIANINPFRYRGYYYDVETGLYYLQSRYYDAEVGRFINADDASLLLLTHSELLGMNLFVYCVNNPVMNSDPTGYWKFSMSTVVAGYILDGLITFVLPYIFTAFKATKLAKWAKASKWLKGKFDTLVKKLSKGIYNAMDSIMYKIMGKAANAATHSFTLRRIQNWVGRILDFSIGYGIAWIIDRFDRDGPSGYIRY